eukprot:scaffold31597_cov112-Isochrysis_galbana.AAC.1
MMGRDAPRVSQPWANKVVQPCSLPGKLQPASASTFGVRAVQRRLRAGTHRSRSSESLKAGLFEALERTIVNNLRGGGAVGEYGHADQRHRRGGHIDARAQEGGLNGRALTRQGSKCGKQGGWVWRTLKVPSTDASTGTLRLEGGSNGRAHTRQGSKCGKHGGLGVAHYEVSSDGREHRDAQAGEGGVAMNLRGGSGVQPVRMGAPFKGEGAHAQEGGSYNRAHTRQAASVGSQGLAWHVEESSDGREHRGAQAGE